jgi:hypothetical protein
MPTARHTYGTAIVLDAAETLAYTAVVTAGGVDYTLDTSDGADPTLTAGTYDPVGFMEHVAKKLRASLFARLGAQPEIAGMGGSPPSAATDLIVRLGIPDDNIVATPGGSLPELYLDADMACSTAGGDVSLKSITLINTSGGAWSRTGLCNFGESRTLSVSAGVVSGDARFQPRWLFCFRAQRRDSEDYEEIPSMTSEPMGDGSAFTVIEGKPVFFRDIALVHQRKRMTGPPKVVAHFSAFGATRNILNIETNDETLLRSMTGTYSRASDLDEPLYLRAGEYWARFKETSSGNLVCYDAWPANLTPTAGSPIQAMSEGLAMVKEWVRSGLLFVYEPVDDDGTPGWLAKCYAPRPAQRGGPYRMAPQRRDDANSLFTLSLSGFLVTKPGLATP